MIVLFGEGFDFLGKTARGRFLGFFSADNDVAAVDVDVVVAATRPTPAGFLVEMMGNMV